jgi:uncharacterized protein (TIGR03435 family)
MKRSAAAACLAGWAAVSVCAQTSGPAFDVASIHPAAPEESPKGNARPHHIHTTPGNVVMRNVGMTEAIQWAYNVEAYQVSGPAWLPQTRFDIVAKTAAQASDDEMRVMMRTLLANRFGLQAHRENKEMPGMALLVAKGGPKLKAADGQGDSVFEPVPKKIQINFRHMSMHEFAALLSEPMHKPVLDLTELPGTYDFLLDGSNYAPPPCATGQRCDEPDEVFMVMRALPDELGLRLEARKLTINMVVVDHIEKVPTEN